MMIDHYTNGLERVRLFDIGKRKLLGLMPCSAGRFPLKGHGCAPEGTRYHRSPDCLSRTGDSDFTDRSFTVKLSRVDICGLRLLGPEVLWTVLTLVVVTPYFDSDCVM